MSITDSLDPRLVSVGQAEAATLLGISEGHLRNMRHEGRGPVYAQIGRRVLYRPVDLDAWLTRHLVGGAA